MKIALSLMLFFFASGARADSCFDGVMPYFKNFERLSGSADEKRQMLEGGCNEMKNIPEMADARSMSEKIQREVHEKAVFPYYMGQSSTVGEKLNGSEAQRKFQARLDEIKKIENPMDRVRKTYELVAKTQGFYDTQNMYEARNLSPGNLIDRAAEKGSAGVCRDFASLLQWSLLQVAKHPSSKSDTLGPNDFSSKFTVGDVPGVGGWRNGSGHAWVRVNLPQFENGQLKRFNTFDVDTTLYPQKFTPLMPRRSGLTPENKFNFLSECKQVSSCLANRAGQDFDKQFPRFSTKPLQAPAGDSFDNRFRGTK